MVKEIKYEFPKIESLSVRDARANLSKIINNVSKTGIPIAIRNKDKVKVAVISYTDAKRYLPEKKLQKAAKKQTFLKALEEWHKKHPVKLDDSLQNLSSEVDKIVYGL